MIESSQPEKPGVPVYRFAPSPNGLLHLGHALSALTNLAMARAAGGRMLLRIEDIDAVRCTPRLESMMLEDLEWIGFEWDEAPVRQSQRLDLYRAALARLTADGLAYPAALSRSGVRERIRAAQAGGRAWPLDPDGAPHYPGDERQLGPEARAAIVASGVDHAWRLDAAGAVSRLSGRLRWRETGAGPAGETGDVEAAPLAWGDVVLGRKDAPASYHLCCVVDDAAQGVSHVVRGRDLFHATSVHRLLQELLGLAQPVYFHHRLVAGEDGRKLSKSRNDTALRHLRQSGATPADIRRMAGVAAPA